MPQIADSMLESINNNSPDIVVITGDLTENGLASEYDGAKDFIDRIECENKVIVPGNHDSRNAGYLFFEDIFKGSLHIEYRLFINHLIYSKHIG